MINSLGERTARLPVRMNDMNVVRPVGVVAHDCPLLAGELVGLLHRVCVPVRPVDPVLKQGNSKDVGEGTSDGPVSVLSIHVCKATG